MLSLSTHANEQGVNRDSFDDLLSDIENNPGYSDLITNSEFIVTRQASKKDIITALNSFGILKLLEENFFLRTNNLKSRSLLDYPEYLPWRHDKDKRAVYVDLFYNQTSRAFFNKNSSNICSYLGIGKESFMETLAEIASAVKSTFNIETNQFLELINLFRTFTVQERRFGFMIGGKTTFNHWHLNVMAPWYYLERNHFVNAEVQEDLDELIADLLENTFGIGPLTPAQQSEAEKKKNSFINNHLISDKFGIGDTRIYLDYPIIKKKNMYTRAGFMATIPTAFAMKKGLRGTSLSRVINRPTLDLLDLAEGLTAPVQKVSEQAFDFGIAALDNLGAMILDTPMGNGGHFGLGVMLRNKSPLSSFIKQDWARRVIMRTFATLEYQFPATEWRSFRVPVDESLFNMRDFTNTSDQAVVNSNFAFILAQLTDRLFPIALQTKVHPGIIFHWSSHMCYEGDYSGFTIGTDTYVRNKEKFSSIDASPATKKIIDVYNARSPIAYQSKAVASVFFKIDKPDKLWTIALTGDYTFMSKGIGADYTLALNVDVAF